MVSKNLKIMRVGHHDLPLPKFETLGAAARDLSAKESVTLWPHQATLVRTGFAVEIPTGLVGMVCSRSGLAAKYGVAVLNAPGLIDCDYRGEIGVILINHSTEAYTVQKGSRIAQLMISVTLRIPTELVTELGETFRGEEGFGSTGQ